MEIAWMVFIHLLRCTKKLICLLHSLIPFFDASQLMDKNHLHALSMDQSLFITSFTWTTEETCSDITSNNLISLGIPPSSLFANKASLSMSDMMMFLMFTLSWRSAQAWRKLLNVLRWNSSGNTWITHSMRYSWAIGSLQLTICSNTPGRTF